jgi:hypothetical protein
MFKFNTYIITENKFMLNFNSFKVKVFCAAFFGQKENYRVTKQKLNTHRIVGTLLLKIFVRNICSYILPKNGYFNLVRAFANNFTNLNSFISYLQIIFLSERINLSKWNCWVGVNCSNCDCSTRICSTLLAANQLLDTNFIICSNPVNPG